MANQRKLSRPSDQRKALLRNQVSEFLWYGRLETTLPRAKEVRSIAEKFITLAMREGENTVTVQKQHTNSKGQIETLSVTNDAPSKLAARRKMMAYLYDLQERKGEKESRTEYRERTKDVAHPLVEKLFREIGPKYRKRAEEKGIGGGYTRILRKGPRRGDSAEMAILELV